MNAILTHYAACGMPIPIVDKQDSATMEEARERAARRIRHLRREGFPVRVLARGRRWEVGEPEGCVLIPDDTGELVLRAFDALAEKYGRCRECDESNWAEGGRGEVYCLNCTCPDCESTFCQCDMGEEEEEEGDEG